MSRWLVAFLSALPAVAHAAAPSCAIPDPLPVPRAEGPRPDQPARDVPITRYTLALIWAPQHCRHPVPGAEPFACTGAEGQGFTLHGLWPDGAGDTWPQWCRPAAILKPATIRAHYCATPSAQLLQHEWAKHGTCIAGTTPNRFFTLSNRLFAGIRTPDMDALSRRPQLSADDVAAAFARADPHLPAAAIRLNLDRAGWLQEVWICLDIRYCAQPCPAGQGGASGAQPVRVWRAAG